MFFWLFPRLMSPSRLTANPYVVGGCQDKGGMEGIWVNDKGNVAETCMGNVAVVDSEGALRSPPYDGSILAGTTLLRAFALAPQLVEVGEERGEEMQILSDSRVRRSSVCVPESGGSPHARFRHLIERAAVLLQRRGPIFAPTSSSIPANNQRHENSPPYPPSLSQHMASITEIPTLSGRHCCFPVQMVR